MGKRDKPYFGGKPKQPVAARAPDRFTVRCPNPDTLVVVGPLVRASWAVPPALALQLAAAGRPVPPLVNGHMLVDTGATFTSIALEVAQALGLQQTRIGDTYGAGGQHKNPVFSGLLHLMISDPAGNSTTLTAVREVMGIPKLNEPYEAMGAQDQHGAKAHLIGLLGRDFLSHVTMTYRGSMGEVEFVLNMQSLRSGRPVP